MELEKYTDRCRGFIQSAHSAANRDGHQQLTPEHILKVLMDDPEGLAANLVRRANGRPEQVIEGVQKALDKIPRVEGPGAGQLYMAPETARLFETAEQLATKAGDGFVTVERLLLALAPLAALAVLVYGGENRVGTDSQRCRRHTGRPQRRHQ